MTSPASVDRSSLSPAGSEQTTSSSSSATPVAGPSSTASASSSCRAGDPLADVYHPYRLQVRDRCLTVTGTVSYIRHEDDGDVHVNLSLPPAESHLLDQANVSYEDGDLVTEIVPADQPGCTPGQPPPLPYTAYRSASYSYGTCTGADVPTPPLGAEVTVTGPYVLDSDHGWMEIHPVWALTVVSQPTSAPEPAQSAEPAPDTEPNGTQTAGSGVWCQASAAPSNDGYPGDYQVYVHSDVPDAKATASDTGDTWSEETNSSGYADIRLYHTSPGMTITVTVGSASCSTTA